MASPTRSGGPDRRRYLQLAGALVGVSTAGCLESLGGDSDEQESESPESDNSADENDSAEESTPGSPINAMVQSSVSDGEVTLSVAAAGAASHFVLRGDIGGVEDYADGEEILSGGTGSTWSSPLQGSGTVSVIGVAANGDGRELVGSFTY
ncbi:hypothetical protein [Halovivax asiaticus]|uniref:hypothetical protein n=1 Tax=Halovivax asiaticus TaxID=332953 RepID=UPI0012671ABD|nr:hypothetical protein [Halovivax asiaticus]